MSKIAIVTDSNSGITKEEADRLGIFVIPMPFMIDDEHFYEGVNLTQEEFYEKQTGGAVISTSQPSPEEVCKLWDKILLDYDEILHLPMSSGLSGACQTAMMLAQDAPYEGKVFVVNNQRISVTLHQSLLDAKILIGKGFDAKTIREKLEEDKFNCTIYIMLDTLEYLKRGGRITPAAAAIGTLLKIKPILQIQGEKLDAFSKARTLSQGKSVMLGALKNDIETRFGGVVPAPGKVWLKIAHTANEEAALQLKEEMLEIFPGYEVEIAPLPLSIACHVGPGTLGVGCCQKTFA